jgi:hypothetical protein
MMTKEYVETHTDFIMTHNSTNDAIPMDKKCIDQDCLNIATNVYDCPIHGKVEGGLKFDFPKDDPSYVVFCGQCIRDLLLKHLKPLIYETGKNEKEK